MKFARIGYWGVLVALIALWVISSFFPGQKQPSSTDIKSLSQSAPQQIVVGTPPQSADDTVRFDRDAAIHKAQFDQLNAGMNACMYRAIHGLLMEGIRSRQQLLAFAKNTCGSGLKKFLISVGSTEAAADTWIDAMANDNLNAALREG